MTSRPPESRPVAERQYSLATADVRGEGPCMDCGTLNTPVWSAPNDLWNRVVGSPDGYLCPWCFTVRAEKHIGPTVWTLQPRIASNDDGLNRVRALRSTWKARIVKLRGRGLPASARDLDRHTAELDAAITGEEPR